MADNVLITAGADTSIAADDIASVFYQRIKLADGTDGSSTAAVVGSGGALFIELIKSIALSVINGSPGFIQSVNHPSQLSVVNGSAGFTQAVSGTFYQATQPVSLAAIPQTNVVNGSPGYTQPVSHAGQISTINGSPGYTQPVSLATAPTTPVTGTFWQTTQPVSIATQLPVINGSAGWTQPVSLSTVPIHAIVNGSAGWTQPVSHAGQIAVVNGSAGYTQPVSLATVPVHTITLGSTGQTIPTSLSSVPVHAVVNGSAGFTQAVSLAAQVNVVNGSAGWFQPTQPYSLAANLVNGPITITGATPTLIIPAPGANLYNFITQFSVINSNGSLSGTAVLANVSGTVFAKGYTQAAGGGFAFTFPAPIRTLGTNEAVYCQLSAASATCYGMVSGYKA